MPGPKVAVVVLNWNGWDYTRECLESLRQLTYDGCHVYLVDNGSTDGSPNKVAKHFPEVDLLVLPENRGFPGGMNVGLRAAMEDGYDYILCLNNDMVAEPGMVEPLLAAAEAGKVVPYPAIYQRESPEVIDSLGNRIDLATGITWMVAHGELHLPERIEADYTEVPMLPRDLLEIIGGWDEDYFAFYEDADLCLRIRRAGWRIQCVPESRVYHWRGRTAGRVPGLVSYYSIRNRLKVVRTHGERWQYLTTLLHVLLLTIPYIGLRCLLSRRYKHSFRYVLLGLADGVLPWRQGIMRQWQMETVRTSKP